MALNIEMEVHLVMEEYCRQLPSEDQSILREYFLPVSEVFKSKKSTLSGLSMNDDELLEQSVREKCVGMPEKRIKKIFRILDKGFKFLEPKTWEILLGAKPLSARAGIHVNDGKCHYTKEFLLERIALVPDSQLSELDETYFHVGYKKTCFDPLSASKVISTFDFEALQEMKIIDLIPSKIHSKKVIYATILDKGFEMTAYHTVIEDNYAQCAKLCVYNITSDLLHSMKKGTKIAIANPYYKKGDADGLCFIRVESPDEVLVIAHKSNPKSNSNNSNKGSKGSLDSNTTPADHKREGNDFFKENKYTEAIKCYTRAIDGDKSNPVYYSNRSLCHIKLQQFEEALFDAERAVQLDANNSKFQYRIAMAWSGLGDHEKSFEILSKLENKTAEQAAALEKERVLLSNTRGEFDFEELADRARKREEIQIGVFVGPISIETSQTHGHTVVATRDIERGELISVSKAVGFISPAKDEDLKDTHLIEHTSIGKSVPFRTSLLIRNTTESVLKSKLTAFRVFNLYHKRNHHEHIPIDLYTSKGYSLIRDKDYPPYQMEQMRDIVMNSEFSYTPYYQTGFLRPSGVWPILSYFNHACTGNFWQKCYRDILIIRACTHIHKGDEVNTSFFDTYAMTTIEERRLKLEYCWNWVCNCELCKFESNPRNKSSLQRAVLLYNKVGGKLLFEEAERFKLLNQVFDLAVELKLGPNRFNSAIWNAIIALTTMMPSKREIRKYLGVMYRARKFLCELDLKHQWYYWMNCVMLSNQSHFENEEFKIEAGKKYAEVESFIMDVL